jgi:hypothetical protein
MPVGQDREELSVGRGCRSGYKYARRHDELWRGQSAAVLRAMERTFMDFYRRGGNGNSLGIALYLRSLLRGNPESRKGAE